MAWPLDLFDPTPGADEISRQLQRILASLEFSRARQLQHLLEFIVQRVLTGEEHRLTEQGLAATVFDRTDFDPQNDSIVRTEVTRLRQRLSTYYAGAGDHDPVLITINKGDYLPQFRYRQRPGFWRRPRTFWLLLISGFALILLLVILARIFMQ